MEDEVRKELLNKWLFYRPKKKSTVDYKIFIFNGTDPCVQHLFQSPVNYPINHQASPSTGTRPFDNFVHSSMPPPPPAPPAKKPISSHFDETVVNGKERECQLCDRAFRNKRHQKLYRDKLMCCICRSKFTNESALVHHAHQNIKANICCLCNMALSDDPVANENHFKRH